MSSIESEKSSIESENSSIESENSIINSTLTEFHYRQRKSWVYLTISLHFFPTRLFKTETEKSSLAHFTSFWLDFLKRKRKRKSQVGQKWSEKVR